MKIIRLLSALAVSCISLASCVQGVEPDTGSGTGAPAVKPEKINSIYRQKMVGMQFTSVSCVNCPSLTAAISSVQEELPGQLIPVAFHMNYGQTDPMSVSECEKFYRRVSSGDAQTLSLPMFALNFRKGSQAIVSQEDKIMSEMQYQSEYFPVCTGVAISTTYDKAAGKLDVTAKFCSEIPQAARYHIILVEDGIDYMQTGAESGEYTHNNVFRYISSENLKGTQLNEGATLVAGQEYKVTKTIQLDPAWNPDAMRVVVAMLTPDAGGQNFGCNNANECAVGESVNYAYVDEDAVFESRFERNVCVMEFTGQWCSWCPAAASLLDYYASQTFKDQFHILAFHNQDVFTIPAEAELADRFEVTSHPWFVVDMRDSGDLQDDGCRLAIEKSLYDEQTHSAVSISSEVADGVCRVDAKLFSEKSMKYRMAAYVVEDKIVAWQTTSTGREENYEHRHVVRKMLSSSVAGDDLGTIDAQQERQQTYEFELDPSWNLENLSVAVLAIDKDFHVNNMAECQLNGGKVEYKTKE